jgi:hypothetical protein
MNMSIMAKKPFKESKVGVWLKEKFPDVLNTVSDLTGIEALGVVANLIDGKKISPEEKAEFQKLKTEYELQVMRMELDNVLSARSREVEVVRASGKPDKMQMIVGLVGLAISIMVVFVGLFLNIRDREIYFHLLGLIEGAILIAIYNYYFASSIGSKSKEAKLDSMMK